MRTRKSIVLSAICLLALVGLATVAPPAALAEPAVLCTVNEDPCSEANRKNKETWLYGHVHPTTAEPTEASVNVPAYSFKSQCEFGKAVTRPAGGVLSETHLSLYSCSSSCVIGEFASEFFGASLVATGKGNGVLTVTAPRMNMACGAWGGTKCKFGSVTMKFEVEGGKTAMLRSTQAMERLEGGLLCPPSVTYQGVLEDWNSPTYVTN